MLVHANPSQFSYEKETLGHLYYRVSMPLVILTYYFLLLTRVTTNIFGVADCGPQTAPTAEIVLAFLKLAPFKTTRCDF